MAFLATKCCLTNWGLLVSQLTSTQACWSDEAGLLPMGYITMLIHARWLTCGRVEDQIKTCKCVKSSFLHDADIKKMPYIYSAVTGNLAESTVSYSIYRLWECCRSIMINYITDIINVLHRISAHTGYKTGLLTNNRLLVDRGLWQ